MRTMIVVALVAAAHIVAVGAVVLIQGCGTTMGMQQQPPTETVMPPARPVIDMPVRSTIARPVAARPFVPVAKEWPVETSTYVVARGDTLSEIANRFDLSVAEIMAMNRITDKNVIRVGQRLTLAGKIDVSTAPPPKRSASAARVTSKNGNYVVQKGDCLSVIAARFGTSVAAIKKANNMSSDRIVVGQKLVVKGSAPAAAPIDGTVAKPATDDVPDALEPDDDNAPLIDMPVKPDTEDATAATAETSDAASKDESFRIYTVGENEDLYTVGLLWNVSVARIRELNGLTDTELKAGQRLKIPTTE